MNERDELAKLIFNVPSEDPACIPSPRATADAILAAGYRKPYTITTDEELRALPVGSVVTWYRGIDKEDVVAGVVSMPGLMLHTASAYWMDGFEICEFPVTVVYTPEA